MMRFSKIFFAGAFLAMSAVDAAAVEAAPHRLIDGPLPITDSMVMGWVISILLVLGIRFMVGRPKLVPSTGQAIIENGINAVREIVEPIVGKQLFRPTFPLLVGIFFFILIHNWSGLLPGVGTIGLEGHGAHRYGFRPANADLNMTGAIALIAAVFGWGYFVLRYAGVKVLFLDLFGNKADRKDVGTPMWLALFPVFFAVGLIEVVSIIFRPVSLSFRLFGNVFGGENLISNMSGMMPYLLPVPFYLLELLIGLVQALVFTLLTAIYIGLICNHGEEGEHH